MHYSQGGPRWLGPFRWIVAAACCWFPCGICAQTPPDLNPSRILGVIPNYQTVSDPDGKYVPLTVRQKWRLALMETIDPFNLANVALGSGSSQWGNRTPKYGEGGEAFSERFGAAWADLATQNFLAGVLATVLHQDPRYFPQGAEIRLPHRVLGQPRGGGPQGFRRHGVQRIRAGRHGPGDCRIERVLPQPAFGVLAGYPDKLLRRWHHQPPADLALPPARINAD